jgi:STE24 endopeptidase
MTTDEICAVFAHELGHGINKDVIKGQILNIFNILLIGIASLCVVR